MKIILLLILIESWIYAINFEENGVKEGNSRLSIGIYGEKHYTKDKTNLEIKFNGIFGNFITQNSEIIFKFRDKTDLEYHTYQLDSGYSHYFLKQPTFTPYIGIELGISGNTRINTDKVIDEEGFYLGVHKFFSENIALTPEIGVEFTKFNRVMETYLDIYLTYFFN